MKKPFSGGPVEKRNGDTLLTRRDLFRRAGDAAKIGIGVVAAGALAKVAIFDPYQAAEAEASRKQAEFRAEVAKRAKPTLDTIGQDAYGLWLAKQKNEKSDGSAGVSALFNRQVGTVRIIDSVKEKDQPSGYGSGYSVSVVLGLNDEGSPNPGDVRSVFVQHESTAPGRGDKPGWTRVWVLGPNSSSGDGFNYATEDYYRIVAGGRSSDTGEAGGSDTENVNLGGMFGDVYGVDPDEAITAAEDGAEQAVRLWGAYKEVAAASQTLLQ